LASDDPSLSLVFDRAWAESIVQLAAQRQVELARESGEMAMRRVEILRLRFREGLAIREIADRWNQDPAHLHREYAKARHEFKQALEETVAFHHAGSPETVEQECANLLEILR
jgi:RNA polymerase sigma-70 factor (ECF subfamily)